MFGIVLSALNAALGFVLRGVVLKFGVMFAAWWLALELVSALVAYVPGSSTLGTAMSAFPPGMWFLLELFRVDIGVPLMLSAFATRFLIRRIPFVG